MPCKRVLGAVPVICSRPHLVAHCTRPYSTPRATEAGANPAAPAPLSPRSATQVGWVGKKIKLLLPCPLRGRASPSVLVVTDPVRNLNRASSHYAWVRPSAQLCALHCLPPTNEQQVHPMNHPGSLSPRTKQATNKANHVRAYSD